MKWTKVWPTSEVNEKDAHQKVAYTFRNFRQTMKRKVKPIRESIIVGRIDGSFC